MKKSGLPRITEASFTRQVIQFSQLHGWKVAHFRPAMTANGWRTAVQGDGVGFPDLVMVRCREPRRQVIFAELKVPPNKTTDEQNQWRHNLLLNGASYYLWTPDNWQEIEEVLQP